MNALLKLLDDMCLSGVKPISFEVLEPNGPAAERAACVQLAGILFRAGLLPGVESAQDAVHIICHETPRDHACRLYPNDLADLLG